MAVTVGNANVRILPDTRGFRQKLEAELKRLKDVEVNVGVDFDADGLVAKAKAAAAEASKAATVHANVDFDSSRLQQLSKLTRSHETVHVDTDFDADGLAAKTKAAVAMAQRSAGDIKVGVRMDRTDMIPVSYTHLTLPTICSV